MDVFLCFIFVFSTSFYICSCLQAHWWLCNIFPSLTWAAGQQLRCVTNSRFEKSSIAGPASSSIWVRRLAHTPDGCNRPKSDPNVYLLSLFFVFFVYSYLLNVGKAVFSFSFYVLLFGLAPGSSGCFQYFYAQVVSMVSLTHDGQWQTYTENVQLERRGCT